MIFEQVATGGCQSYLVGCADTLSAGADRSRDQPDRPLSRRWRPATACTSAMSIDTHTHADHFSAAKQLAEACWASPAVMHQASPAPHARLRLDDDDLLRVGNLRIRALHTPGHTARFHVPGGRGPRVHRRHAADRRHGPHRSAHRRSRPALRQPVRQAAASWTRRCWSFRRTTTRDGPIRPSAPRSPTIRGCRSASAPNSSR